MGKARAGGKMKNMCFSTVRSVQHNFRIDLLCKKGASFLVKRRRLIVHVPLFCQLVMCMRRQGEQLANFHFFLVDERKEIKKLLQRFSVSLFSGAKKVDEDTSPT